MDPRLLDYYNRELQFAREMGSEFAQAYPRIAARLGLEGLECAEKREPQTGVPIVHPQSEDENAD